MKIENIDVSKAIEEARERLQDEALSPGFKSAIELLLLIVSLLAARLGLNSKNSSKPPSLDPNRLKKLRSDGTRKPGGQIGHVGTTLLPVENPDEICELPIDRKFLPRGKYKEIGFEKRQVMDIVISRIVTEYRAQVLEDEHGKQFTAPFPKDVNRPIQYGNNIKAHSVYMSQYQLVPFNRLEEYFREFGVPISQGTLVNFNAEAAELLTGFDELAKIKLSQSDLLHVDETSINIDGKKVWLHGASNDLWTHLAPHAKRGTDAMDEIGIIPKFSGILCHDHWKAYYSYTSCLHSLCNAHHLRELEAAFEQKQQWAKEMQDFLLKINKEVQESCGTLDSGIAEGHRISYRKILQNGEIQSPPPDASRRWFKNGKQRRSKERNLLERLQHFEDDVLRFMENQIVPFTNNLAERTIRMSKVQQKISGCFRSIEGARNFCLIRSYISTCQKHGIAAAVALNSIFTGKMPPMALVV
jgi:transposase